MPIKQTIEIVWHPMTERPTRFDRYLVAEANCRFKDGQTLVHYDVNERSFCRRLWTHGQSGTPYACNVRKYQLLSDVRSQTDGVKNALYQTWTKIYQP